MLIMSIAVQAQIKLTIVIKDLKNNKGFILMDFRDGKDKPLLEFKEKIVNNQCIIEVKGLNPGKYAFKYFHDENNNKELDTYWYGAPKEGYGFSNNAKGAFGPPSFKKTIFEIKKDTTVTCIPTYFKL